jgi:hypothetical protein
VAPEFKGSRAQICLEVILGGATLTFNKRGVGHRVMDSQAALNPPWNALPTMSSCPNGSMVSPHPAVAASGFGVKG